MISICMITIKTREEVEDRIQEACNNATSDFQFVFVSNKDGGVAENRNVALRKATGDYIIYIDDDLYEYPKGWDTALLNVLQTNKYCLMVGPRLLNMDGSLQKTISRCSDIESNLVRVPYLPGACMCYKKNGIFFDERFKRWGCEDPDFELEMKKENPNGYFTLCNIVKLKHKNEMKNINLFGIKNKELFRQKWGFLVE